MTLDDRRPVDLPPVHEALLPREHSLHRPRHGGRQLTALVSALVFFGAPTVMSVLGMRPSELENHELASFPSVWDGWGFLTGMDGWATDNLVFRAEAIEAADWVSRTFFGESAPFDQGGTTPSGPLPGSPSEDETGENRPNDPDNVPDKAGFRRVVEGEDGWLYLGEDVISKCQPVRPFTETVDRLNQLRQIIEDSGREFVLVAVPDKSTAVPEHLPDSYGGKDCAESATPRLWEALRGSGAVDMRGPLEDVAEELGRPPYFPLDSHWTNEGALEMVRQVAERVEPGITEDWEVSVWRKRASTADLPPLIGQEGTNDSTSYRLSPDDGETDRTARVLGDLREPIRRTSEPVDGMVDRPTLLVGDSFTLPVSAFLPAAFADCTQVFYSTVDGKPELVAQTMADNEVVVLEVVERNLARGDMRLLDQGFLDLVREYVQNRPIR